jgi:hypothetical protein
VSRIALLMNPTNPNVDVERMDAESGARKFGLETIALYARNAREIDAAFEQLLGAKADGIITATDPIPLDRREQIAEFANRHKLPLMGFVRQFAAAGALLSYGPSISWMYRQAGEYVAQILKGRESGRTACPAADPVRVGDQSQDRKFIWPHRSTLAPSDRQRDNRVKSVYFHQCSSALMSAYRGAKQKCDNRACGSRTGPGAQPEPGPIMARAKTFSNPHSCRLGRGPADKAISATTFSISEDYASLAVSSVSSVGIVCAPTRRLLLDAG